MQAQEFHERIRRRADGDAADDPHRATEAVIATLGERATDAATEPLAAELPGDVAAPLDDAPGEAGGFDREAFLARIADRADVPLDGARAAARAVLSTVEDAVDEETLTHLRAELPDEFDDLFEAGRPHSEEAFVAAVADRSDSIDRETAREHATATLRTLGERLSEGEAADLATYLPPFAADALVAAAPAEPPDVDRATFLARLAERTGLDEDRAADRARAVLATVADAAGETELRDALSQLPNEYLSLFDAAGAA